jgi:hypothetical protein
MTTRVRGVDNVPHLVGTGPDAIVLVLPDVYAGIGAALGVVELTGDPPAGATATTVGNAIKAGLIRKIRITYLDGTKRKRADLVVSLEKSRTAAGALTGSTFRSFKIRTAYYPTRIRLG